MQGSLGSLVVSLSADTGTFESDMGKAAVIAETQSRRIVTSSRETSKILRELSLGASTINVSGLEGLTHGSQLAKEALGGLAGAVGLLGIASWPVAVAVAAAGAIALFAGEAGEAAKQAKALEEENDKLARSLADDKSEPFRENAAKNAYALSTLKQALLDAQIAVVNLQKTQASNAGLSGKAGAGIQAADAAAVVAAQHKVLDIQAQVQAQTNEVTEAFRSMHGEATKAYEEQIKPIAELKDSLEEQYIKFDQSGTAALKYELTLGKLAGSLKALGPDAAGTMDDLLRLQGVLDVLEHPLKPIEMITFKPIDIKPVTAPLSAAEKYAHDTSDAMQQTLGTDLQNALKGNFDNILQSFIDMLAQMVAQAYAARVVASFNSSGASGSFGNFLSWVSGGSSPATGGTGHAAGGSVMAGVAYPVGEMGPETFVPNVPGVIMPTGGAGGGVTFNMPIDARGADAGSALRMYQAGQILRRQLHGDVDRKLSRGRWQGG